MPVIRAGEMQLIDVMFLLKKCTEDMNRKGMFNWNSAYPSPNTVEQDIQEGSLFIYEENRICMGMIVLNTMQSEEYHELSWTAKDEGVLVVHRLAVHPVFQGKGIGKKLMEFAISHMASEGYKSMRLDVIESNREANSLYRKLGFRETGTFRFPFQKDPFTAYEMLIP